MVDRIALIKACAPTDIHNLLVSDLIYLLLQGVNLLTDLLHVRFLHAFRHAALLTQELFKQIGCLFSLLLHFGLKICRSCIEEPFHIVKNGL